MRNPRPPAADTRHSSAYAYALWGTLFGLSFPLVATLVDALIRFKSVAIHALVTAQTTSPLQWIIDTAPLFLGLFASIAGSRQDSLQETIRELTRLTTEIVDTGDLTQRTVAVKTGAGRLFAEAFEQMQTKLREIPAGLHDLGQALNAAVSALNCATQEQTALIGRQAGALQETQAIASEIEQSSAGAAQRAIAVLQLAERADEIARSGEGAIEQSLSGLGDIRAQVKQIANKITELGGQTQQIGSITDTVKNLANQSNILALNAAIEAARAGQHGRGFTVVAREVRSLADRSIQATTDVKRLLGDITHAVAETVQITEHGTSRMETGLVQVRASGEHLRALSAIVKDTSDFARQIAAIITQQNAGIAQISSAVNDLSSMMSNTRQGLESTATVALTLTEVSDKITRVISRYRF